MTIATQKKLMWFMFAVSLQTCSFVFLSLAFHMAFYRGPTFYPPLVVTTAVFCMPCVEIARSQLAENYRREPPPWTGRWQISLSDLITITFFGATAMTLARQSGSDGFFLLGLPMALSLTLEFALAMLLCSRIGYSAASTRGVMSLVMLTATVFSTLLAFLVPVFCFAFLFLRA